MSSKNENDASNFSDNTQTTSNSMTTPSPTWAPPKAPLPPHRLAKLANALGVSTPVPVYHRNDRIERSPSPFLTAPSPLSSAHSLGASEVYASFRRSPTPSSAGSIVNSGTPYTYTSKYLLHVVPPIYLPHGSQLRDNAPSGSGYHSHFRRGILVPVHPTFQAQLWAIAKEYALPSTAGLVLYTVDSPQAETSPTGMEGDDEHDEPGPRLSEEIWKHLWTRVWKVEREELPPIMPSLGLPGPVSLSPGAANFATRSTPFLLNEASTPVSPLRPFISNAGNNSVDTALNQMASYPSPSTPSSASTLAFTRSRSPVSEGPEIDTPLTSHSNSLDSMNTDPNFLRANSLPLPGLNSPSLMPILAKVEFDIDRRKSGWYEPWARRRRIKKAKKTDSNRLVNDPPKRLKLSGGVRATTPASLFSAKDPTSSEGYEPLSDYDSEDEEDDEDIGDEDETARVLSTSGSDALQDVFGTDADAWADLKGSRPRRRNLHDLALTGEELDDDENEFEDAGIEQGELTKGAEEISEIMARMGQNLTVDVSPIPVDRSNSVSRKRIPPPLVLHPAGSNTSKEVVIPSPLNSANSLNDNSGSSTRTSLPYLKTSPDIKYEDDVDSGSLGNELDAYPNPKSPLDSEKRTGGVYDDLDLDLGEFDENDPHDRRKSQIILKAKLDEIERNLVQLSPRALKIDLEDDHLSNARLSSPRSPFLAVPSTSTSSTPVLMNSDVLPPTPSKETYHDTSPTRPRSGTSSAASPHHAQWPAVPYSSLSEEDEAMPASRRSHTESQSTPPRLAVNGVSTFASNAFKRKDSLNGSSVSAETMQRRKEAEDEDQLYYPALNSRSIPRNGSDSNSPVIPLSPDPFGRFSSTPEQAGMTREVVKVWDSVPIGGSVGQLIQNSKGRQSISVPNQEAPPRMSEASSRFSADSIKDGLDIAGSVAQSLSGSSTGNRDSAKDKSANRSTVMSMKGIKKLWRKSNKNSISVNGPPTPVPESPPLPSGFTHEELRSLNVPLVPSASSSRAPSPQNLTHSSAAPVRPTRPPKEELDLPDIPEQLTIPLQSANSRPAIMPIIAAQMQAGLYLRSAQDSPYPAVPFKNPQQRKMSVSTNNIASATSQTSSRAPSPASSAGGSIGAAAGSSMMEENRKANVRKSILKWKTATTAQRNAEQADFNGAPSRPGTERAPSNGTVRTRGLSLSRPSSVHQSDIPPSPQVPEHLLLSRAPSDHSHLTTSSTDSKLTTATDISSVQSVNSSSSSQTSYGSPPSKLKTELTRNTSLDSNAQLSIESKDIHSDNAPSDDDDANSTRPSIDSSQFEIVSPKMKVGSLSYPYTTVGHND